MRYQFLLLIFILGSTQPALASLESEAQSLQLPDNHAPAGVQEEKLYAVQTRFVPLTNRFEFSVGGAKNFNPGSFLVSNEVSTNLHFYFSDRFFASLYGSYVFNSLSGAGERLWQGDQIFPDISTVKYRADATVGFNLFYGKFRMTMDSVFYFDQYLSLGAGYLGLTNGIADQSAVAAVAEVGFVFWFARQWNARLGVKDYYFNEVRRLSSGSVHHILGSVSLGFLFGGGGDA